MTLPLSQYANLNRQRDALLPRTVLFIIIVCLSLVTRAQTLKEGYVDWGTESRVFHNTITLWIDSGRVNDDDNFFISRVKPKERFRNAATQVRSDIDEDNDKHVLAWLPCNSEDYNALPDGRFDAEVFSMWQYVTHWGNWSCPLGRVPGAFLDVAHKNGVAVSSVADIPAGTLTDEYAALIDSLPLIDADSAALFFNYYGVDGLGYNSEFTTSTSRMRALQNFHASLVSAVADLDPLFENIWYDGTTSYGKVLYDAGLDSHNERNFGDGSKKRTSLFLNYNWNDDELLSSTEEYAVSLDRDPLDVYCGFNLQGLEPAGESWSMLQSHKLSIGLWGAHGENMFWESRQEKGATDLLKQNTYRLRIEKFFTGGSRNPVDCPEITDFIAYNADNDDFCGISTFATARSTLSWDLSREPFVTYFNVGNGTFFNLAGHRASDSEWYNIGLQDYLPTWRYWFAPSLLGKDSTEEGVSGLAADFVYEDAYYGGSCLSVRGTAEDEYLHLFKTEFALAEGDVITVRYKVREGRSRVALVVSAKDAEREGVEYELLLADDRGERRTWREQTFSVGSDFDGKEIALVAIHFTDAVTLDMLIGEFSIVRGSFACPETPVIESAKILYNSIDGCDGKLIFNMPGDEEERYPCYNVDVGVSQFRLYAQREGGDIVFMGATTSWAALFFRIPYESDRDERVRLGVSAISLDMSQESEIAWTDYMDMPAYVCSDDIQRSSNRITTGERFTLSYVDESHEEGTWQLVNADNDTVYTASGQSVTVDGISEAGLYDLVLYGYEYADSSTTERVITERTFNGYVQITETAGGAEPEIYSLTANGRDDAVNVAVGDTVTMSYTGKYADGTVSRGIDLDYNRFGVYAEDVGIGAGESFSITFWLRINSIGTTQPTQLFSIADKQDEWSKTDWGWLWFDINGDGTIDSYTFRGSDDADDPELEYVFDNTILPIGNWMHVAMVFEYASEGFRSRLYINGKEQEVTRWKRSDDDEYNSDGEPGYESDIYEITSGQVIAVGGDASGRDGIDGAIDNFEVWNKALSADEVLTSMGDIPSTDVPDGLAAAWDMESDVAEDYTMACCNGSLDARAGLHYYQKTGSEGQGTLTWTEPEYVAGCPFITGDGYEIITLASWNSDFSTLIASDGDSESGTAQLKYDDAGEYDVTLTLANDYGEASQTYSSVNVSELSGIGNIGSDICHAYVLDGNLYIRANENGDYSIAVYALDGATVARRHAHLTSGEQMTVNIGRTGAYTVSVKRGSSDIATFTIVVP